MGGPDPFVIGDGLVVTHHLNPVQIGAHLHAAPDHRGMHRVVIAIRAHVVIARQPRRDFRIGWAADDHLRCQGAAGMRSTRPSNPRGQGPGSNRRTLLESRR